MTRTAIIEAFDARAEGRRRYVEVSRRQIVIARRVDGVDMRLSLLTQAYRGVALTVLVSEGADFLYQVRLTHNDADLSVTLAECDNEAQARANWRRWAEALGLARLIERAEGDYETDRTPPAPFVYERRRGRATLRRRNRFLARRKMGQRTQPSLGAEG